MMPSNSAPLSRSPDFLAGRRAGLQEALDLSRQHLDWLKAKHSDGFDPAQIVRLDIYCIERRLRHV